MEAMPQAMPLLFFEPRVLALLDSWSKALFAHPASRQFPEIAALAFWCRRSAIQERQAVYQGASLRIGRGMALHIAPGNLPLNFAYSLVAGLLAGNANVVRLPSKEFVQTELVCTILRELLKDTFDDLRPYVACLRYPAESPLTQALCAVCDAQVLWGGDETIQRIRAFRRKPRAVELCFANRWSICVIDGAQYLASTEKDALARGFFNDAYLEDQRSCAAPRALLWLGTQAAQAQADFWPRVQAIVQREYQMLAVLSVAKWEAFCRIAAVTPAAKWFAQNHLLVRVQLPTLLPAAMELHPGGGFFLEATADSLDALVPICGEKCQTVSQFGVAPEAFATFIRTQRPQGIDRIVKIGHTLDFSLVWDGIDLPQALSRVVTYDG